MEFDDIRKEQKKHDSIGFMENIKKALKEAKVPFVIAGSVATMGVYDFVKFPSDIKAINTPIQAIQELQSVSSHSEKDYPISKFANIQMEQFKTSEQSDKKTIDVLLPNSSPDIDKQYFETSKAQFLYGMYSKKAKGQFRRSKPRKR